MEGKQIHLPLPEKTTFKKRSLITVITRKAEHGHFVFRE